MCGGALGRRRLGGGLELVASAQEMALSLGHPGRGHPNRSPERFNSGCFHFKKYNSWGAGKSLHLGLGGGSMGCTWKAHQRVHFRLVNVTTFDSMKVTPRLQRRRNRNHVGSLRSPAHSPIPAAATSSLVISQWPQVHAPQLGRDTAGI